MGGLMALSVPIIAGMTALILVCGCPEKVWVRRDLGALWMTAALGTGLFWMAMAGQ